MTTDNPRAELDDQAPPTATLVVEPEISVLRGLPLLGVIGAIIAIALDYFAHARAYQLNSDTLHEAYNAWESVPSELLFVIAPWLLVALIHGGTIRKYSWLMDITRVASLFPVYFTFDLSSVEIPMWWHLGIPPQTEGVPLGDFDIGWTIFYSYPLCILTVVTFAFYKLNTGSAKIAA